MANWTNAYGRWLERLLERHHTWTSFSPACATMLYRKGFEIERHPKYSSNSHPDLAEVFDTAWRKTLKEAAIHLMKKLKRYYKSILAELNCEVETRKQDIQVNYSNPWGTQVTPKTPEQETERQ